MAWNLVEDADAVQNWDHWLQNLAGATIHQTYGWGKAKQQLGWQTFRLAYRVTEPTPRTLLQVQVRRYPFGVALIWIPGGPAGDLNVCDSELWRILRHATGAWQLYCRMNSLRARTAADVAILQQLNWCPPRTRLMSGLSLEYNPSVSESERIQQATGNWRHNLKRSGKYGLTVYHWQQPNVVQIMDMYQNMEHYKGLAAQTTAAEVSALIETLKDKLIIYRCDDSAGTPIALRGCGILHQKAWDLFAVATIPARKVYASYATFWALMQACAQRQVSYYDLCGIDPVGNRGVYDFKKGSGAWPLEYLGEWEWATHTPLKWAANWMIQRRGGH